jgi:hypothetical protein
MKKKKNDNKYFKAKALNAVDDRIIIHAVNKLSKFKYNFEEIGKSNNVIKDTNSNHYNNLPIDITPPGNMNGIQETLKF